MKTDAKPQPLSIDLEILTPRSRELAELFLERWPELAERMSAEDYDGRYDLVLRIPSPTGDAARVVTVSMESELVPCIEFGSWRMPGDVLALASGSDDELEVVVDAVGAIMNDHMVIVSDGESADSSSDVVDLRKACALEQEMAGLSTAGRAILKSWSGALDRKLSLNDLCQ